MSTEPKFTVEEFRTYLRKQESFGDVLYYLNAENIKKAQRNYCSECMLSRSCEMQFERPTIDGAYIACETNYHR